MTRKGMTRKKFRQITTFVSAAVGGAMGMAVASGNAIAAVVILLASQLAMFWLKSRVTEVTTDEMTLMYEGRIAKKVFGIFSISITAVAVVLVCLREYDKTLSVIGMTLAATAIFAMFLQLIVQSIYTRGLREDGNDDN